MRRPLVIVCGAFVMSLAVDAFFLGGRGHGEFWWSDVYGFFSLLGFFGCLATILLAKFLGELWLQRRENYYDFNHRHE
jgi:hypothetical protein